MDAAEDSPVAVVARVLRAVRRRVLLHRRPLAALLAGLAVLAGAEAMHPPAVPTVPVWTVAHDVTGGSVLTRADLAQVGFRPQSLPSGRITDPGAVVGRTVARPLHRGEPLTDLSVLDVGLRSSYAGLVTAPVRITDSAVVALLRAGDRVDLVAADPQARHAPVVVVRSALVVTVPPAVSGSTPTDLDSSGRLVVLAVPPDAAADVTAAAASGLLTLYWSR